MEIAKETKIKQSNVSVALSELERKGLVSCLTPDKLAWKVFRITEAGIEVLDMLTNDRPFDFLSTSKKHLALADKKNP